MVDTEHSAEQRRILQALADLEDRGQVPTVGAVALRARLDMAVVFPALNDLFVRGDVTPSLTLTEQGRSTVVGA